MKPTIPETGRVIRLEGETAIVLLQGGESCKGCGMGKLGLCKPSGHIPVLTVINTANARVGDTITIGLARKTQMKGFLLAFVVPLACFLVGSFAGYGLGKVLSLPFLEVLSGFAALVTGSWFSLGKLRKLDSSPSMVAEKNLSANIPDGEITTEEEKRFEAFAENL